MKRSLAIAVSLCAVMIGGGAASAAATNFAGTWVLDKSNSKLSGRLAQVDGITFVVTQDDKKLTVESKTTAGGQERPPTTLSYDLGGSETTADISTGQMRGTAKLKAKWQDGGKILELTSVRNVEAQGQQFTITQVEHWELTDGGKGLKVHRSTESPQGTQEATLVFTKK